MDEALKITLPSIIGIIISTPIMALVDMTKLSTTEIFLIMLPMMAGAALSMVVCASTMRVKKK